MSYQSTPYKIIKVTEYTSDVKAFRVKSTINPKPGTFIEVSVPGIGEAPLASCSCSDKYLDILTRNAGNVTSKMFQLKKGDTVYIRGPYGRGFPVEELKGKNIVLVAGGTGIAPVTSMIDYIVQNRKDFKEIFIYFGFRNEKYILLQDKIEKYQKLFHVNIGLSEATNNTVYEQGYIQSIIENHKPVIEDTVALICGPEIMMECVTEELNKLGVADDKIYWSMERRMECAFGSCGRCQLQDLYVCKDGPVFRYDIIKPRLANESRSNEVK